jgi:flagellar FliL protein
MSELEAPKPEEAEKGKAPSSGNKLLIIIALGNFLGVFALGGYLAYDKLIASKHAAAQAGDVKKEGEHGEKKEGEHGAAEKKEEGHGEAKEEGGHGEEKKAEGHGGGHGEGAEVDESLNPPDSPGPIMALEPIVTNLSAPDDDRYLKVTVQLRVTSESAKSEVEASIVPIRSQILMFFSSLTVADISGADKRRQVQSQVRRIANEAMPSSRIRFVYFTEFVVQ